MTSADNVHSVHSAEPASWRNPLPPRVWEGPRGPELKNSRNWLVHIGWWYEPEARFVPITEAQPPITGSAHLVYVEVGD